MQKYIQLVVAIAFIYSLSSCENKDHQSTGNSEVAADSVNIEAGKSWLKNAIETYFNNDDNFLKGFEPLCTEEYAEFKSDASNVDLDGGMTVAEFKAKWEQRYSQYAGIGEGFMIAGSDFGTIEVEKCAFETMTETQNYQYNVVMVDKTLHSKFTRKVVLFKTKDSFLIDDVFEISNEFAPTN